MNRQLHPWFDLATARPGAGRIAARAGATALGLALLHASAIGQTTTVVDLGLTSADLPAGLSWPPTDGNFFKGVTRLHVQVGDLTGDGVPDVMLYNGFTYRAFVRMEYANPTTRTGWQPATGGYHVLDGTFGSYGAPSAAVLSCANTHDITIVPGTTEWDLRHTSWRAWGNDFGVIGDFDCDGVNEWVYPDWRPGGSTITGQNPAWREPSQHKLFMQLWDYDAASGRLEPQVDAAEANAQIAAQDLSTAIGRFSYGSSRLFPGVFTNAIDGVKCQGGMFGAGHVTGVIGYNRVDTLGRHGAAYTWHNGDFDPVGFSQGVGGSATPAYTQGGSGHHLTLADVNCDGIDEICDKRVVTPRYASGSWSVDLQWTLMSLSSHSSFLPLGMTSTTLNHFDDFCAGDYLESHIDDLGRVVPMPGVELIATADDRSNGGNKQDWHGPAVFRGVLGQDYDSLLQNPQQTSRSPLRILSTAGSSAMDGEQYMFPSISSWVEPAATSLWSVLGPLLWNGTATPAFANQQGFDLQLVYLGNFIASSPGFELGARFKDGQAFSYNSENPYMMFGGTPDMPALSWGFDSPTGALPGASNRYVVDVVGDRSAQELVEVFVQPAGIFRFVPNASGTPAYKAEEWHNMGYANSTPLAADIIGDGAEEIYRLLLPNGSSNARVRIVQDTTTARTHASPNAYAEPFIDPLRQNPIDFESLDGLRFASKRLIHGTAGVPYGVPLDDSVDPLAGSLVGTVLVPEGGDPMLAATGSRYNVTLNTPLPTGLTGTFLPGNTAQREHGGVFLLSGTPTEACWRELTFQITDNATGAQQNVTRWIHIADAVGALPDSAPRIDAVWTSTSGLTPSGSPNVDMQATVTDADGDFGGVFLVVEPLTGQFWVEFATLVVGTADRWAYTIDATPLQSAPVGTVFHLQIVALDAAGKFSNVWPYMNVPGDNTKFADWVTGSVTDVDLRVSEVELPPHTIVPAECFAEGDGLQTIIAYVDDTAADQALKGEAVIRHVVDGVVLDTVSLTQDPTNSNKLTGTFVAPEAWFGGGNYTVNVRIQDAQKNWSEWWPRLVIQ